MQEKLSQLLSAMGIGANGTDKSVADKLKESLSPEQQSLAEQLLKDPKAAAEFMKSQPVREILSQLKNDKGG